MEILNAVNMAWCINSERDSIQAAKAHYTDEALRVVGLSGSSKNPLHDWLGTNAALLQSALHEEIEQILLMKVVIYNIQNILL